MMCGIDEQTKSRQLITTLLQLQTGTADFFGKLRMGSDISMIHGELYLTTLTGRTSHQ